MSKHIFGIAYYPKSGNTLLRAILSSLFFSKDGTSSFELIEATNGPFFRSSKNNQWKRILNKDQIKKIENKFSKTMLAFGYELSKE